MGIKNILILEIITVSVIFCLLTTVKYVFPKTFNDVFNLYKENLSVETEIELVIGE